MGSLLFRGISMQPSVHSVGFLYNKEDEQVLDQGTVVSWGKAGESE